MEQSYHSRIMNIPGVSGKDYMYRAGHKDARHASAEIAAEADAEIEQLRQQNAALNSSEFVQCYAIAWDAIGEALRTPRNADEMRYVLERAYDKSDAVRIETQLRRINR